MDLNSIWIKATGPAVIAAIVVGAIVTGAYSTDRAAPPEAAEPAPLPDEVRYGAIEIGPVAPGTQYAARPESAPSAASGAPLARREGGVARWGEPAPSIDVASAPLQVEGYVRYLEIGAFSSRSEADAEAASVASLVRQEARMGDVAVVYAPDAISQRFRVHIGPFAGDVTNEDVRVFKDLIGEPGAVIVSIVKTPASSNE